LKKLLADPATYVSRSKTADNRLNLAPGFIEYLSQRYGGTRLGRQEMDAELIEDREDALWRRDAIEKCRCEIAPDLKRIVVAVDPPAGEGTRAGRCGIVAAGAGTDGRYYVLADRTVPQASPTQWANAVVALYHELKADMVVAEVNQGGALVKMNIGLADDSVQVRTVSATRGKWVRAEPVAMLYEQGRVAHAGTFPELEDEMCDFGRDGLAGGRSPDRVDALVWALTDLALTGQPEPRIRTL
jgi:phage terminase large subunit-like protein